MLNKFKYKIALWKKKRTIKKILKDIKKEPSPFKRYGMLLQAGIIASQPIQTNDFKIGGVNNGK